MEEIFNKNFVRYFPNNLENRNHNQNLAEQPREIYTPTPPPFNLINENFNSQNRSYLSPGQIYPSSSNNFQLSCSQQSKYENSSMESYGNFNMKPADISRTVYTPPQQQVLPSYDNPAVGISQQQYAQPNSEVNMMRNQTPSPHIYSIGYGIQSNFDNRNVQMNNPLPSHFGGQKLCTKVYMKNHSNRKFSKNMFQKKDEIPSDFNVTPQMLGIIPSSEPKSNFITIIGQFSSLSTYTMEMSKERMLLDKLITGLDTTENKNDLIPTVISNITSHIKIVRQSLGYEFYEISKLIDSLRKQIQFEEKKEFKVQEILQKNLNELENFENIKIKQKNGEILLCNEKNFQLERIVKNIIDCIRYYCAYLTILRFKYNELTTNNVSNNENITKKSIYNKKDLSNNKGEVTLSSFSKMEIAQHLNLTLPTSIEQRPINKRTFNRRSHGF